MRILEQRLIDTIREQYELFGFAPIETAAVERMEVLLSKGGIPRQIYTLGRAAEDADSTEAESESEASAQLGLHFDLTVPLARYVAQHGEELVFPFRRYQIQKVWRGERAQRGRFREFYQCDADIVGSGSLDLMHDAEMAGLIDTVFTALGIGDFVVRVSNRGILQALCAAGGLSPDQTAAALRIVDKFGGAGQPEAAARALEEAEVPGKLVTSIAELLAERTLDGAAGILTRAGAPDKSVEDLAVVIDGAGKLGMPSGRLVPDFSIARGLDYYTGTVYETFVRGRERWGSVCSGGRYDDLATYFTRRVHPGVGVSIGLSRLLDLMVAAGMDASGASTPARVLVTMLDRDRYLPRYLCIAHTLRQAHISTEVYLQPDALRDQLAYAAAKGFAYAVIAGQREFDAGVVSLRDLATREQRQVPVSEVTSAVSSGQS
jgi:histidyl-tRNA synthetase